MAVDGQVTTARDLRAADRAGAFPLADSAPEQATDGWGLRVAAPDDESGLLPVLDAAVSGLREGPSFVAVHGGSSFTRVLVAEEMRIRHGVPTLLVEPDADVDRATTLILSGRTDLVGGQW